MKKSGTYVKTKESEDKKERPFIESVIEIKRVSKKTKGGNKIGFKVLVAVGNEAGLVGAALGRAPNVPSAISKGMVLAKKNLIEVHLVKSTIPHQVHAKFGAAKVFLKPAPPGAGIIAGGAVRKILALAGIRDVSAKILGSPNKTNNIYAVMEALKKLG